MDPNFLTYIWLGLGLVAGAAYFVFSKSYGKACCKFLANGLIIAALIYVGFAIAGGDVRWIVYEGLGVLAFGIFALLGRRRSVWWLAAGWALHPLWDLGLHGQGVGGAAHAPEWYVIACLSFDLLVAVLIAKDYRTLHSP